MVNNRLVYSTESGRVCPSCGHPTTKCTCKNKKPDKKQSIYPNDGIVRIRREIKGRKGKTVTAVSGLPLNDKKLQQVAKTLKRLCGSGGTVKDGVIIIQGDHRETLLKEIKQQGYTAILSGG
jgi:translation initiation factor 1